MKTIPIVTMNVDRPVNAKFFEGLSTISYTSMFRTIQGEGPYAGYPSVFLRLAGCNFGDKTDRCDWCDTNFKIDEASKATPEGLLTLLKELPGYNAKDVLVITGGEPTLQHKLLELIMLAQSEFFAVQLETNGSQAAFFAKVRDLRKEGSLDLDVVVSPKASNSLGIYPPLSPTVMNQADCLKFVLSSDPTSPHHRIPEWAREHSTVYVSPMAVYKKPYTGEVSSIWDTDLINAEATAANYAYSAKYAMDHNVLLSLQTHLFTAVP